MAHDVFISHAHKDKGIANAICEKLESAGVRCWIAPRDISPGEDWTKAIRNAIGSSRVIIPVLPENANASPHMEREIANAFYIGHPIVPFRLAKALPQRELLFYLGDARWCDAANPPSQQDLETLVGSVKSLLADLPVPGNDLCSPGAMKKPATLNFVNSPKSELRISCYRIPRIVKHAAIAASTVAVVWLLWFASRQTNRDASYASQSMYYRARASPSQAAADASESTPRYTFTRLGLWVAAIPSATPLVQSGPQDTASAVPAGQSVNATPSPPSNVEQDGSAKENSVAVRDNARASSAPANSPRTVHRRERHRGKPQPKAHNEKVSAFERLQFANIKRRLRAFWHKFEARNKETWNRE
jgi:hypothetical protein